MPPDARRLLRRVARKVSGLTGESARPSGASAPGRVPGRGPDPRTVAQGWDRYAKRRLERSRVGDVWNNPAKLGIDVNAPDDVVPYLDRNVIEPFLGPCDVMLEIGAGGGRLTEVLLPKCQRLIAVDTAPNMLELLRKRFPDDARLDLQLVDGQGLAQVEDESVDAAFSYDVFVHLQHWDIYNYLTELSRVLRPGGKAVIHHSNLLSELGWKQFRYDVDRQLNRHKLPWSFVANTPELMRELIARAGLECIRMDTETVRRDCIAFIRKPGA
jgi:ubiquinone/menaquinone biosynthesis C-methylase UbiE